MPREDRLVDLSADRHGAQHDGIEVKEFPRSATVNFLRDRVPQLAQASDAEVDRLASVLGDLALAAQGASPCCRRRDADERSGLGPLGELATVTYATSPVATPFGAAPGPPVRSGHADPLKVSKRVSSRVRSVRYRGVSLVPEIVLK
jgi:hypothetical protein